MNNFHKILYSYHGKNKSNIEHVCSNNYPFRFRSIIFGFTMNNYRKPEELILNVKIPVGFKRVDDQYSRVIETYFLYKASTAIRDLYINYINTNKETFSKAAFFCQQADRRILKRSAIKYDRKDNLFVLHINFNMPLLNGVAINQKPSEKAIRDILSNICNIAESITQNEIDTCVRTFYIQQIIRKYLIDNHYCAFIANGSILPREKDTDEPMNSAIPFSSPKSLELLIPIDNVLSVTGMGIKSGVTVVTGGGYSGKSTLLDALQEGIYDRLPGDGREYVITDNTAIKTFAEDGRPVSHINISPFFKYVPGSDVSNFSTDHASGSVSQAANIIEAICGKSKLLLIDEDKSATNLMIQDEIMRQLVTQDPIIPFTERIKEFFDRWSVSTIIVIGGCSEYLFKANCVLLMENYIPKDITCEVEHYNLNQELRKIPAASVPDCRFMSPKVTNQTFLYIKNIMTEDQRKIILDNYCVDITMLPIIKNQNQMNAILIVLANILCDKTSDSDELIRKLEKIISDFFSHEEINITCLNLADRRYYEEVRALDVYWCLNRIRGLHFYNREE